MEWLLLISPQTRFTPTARSRILLSFHRSMINRACLFLICLCVTGLLSSTMARAGSLLKEVNRTDEPASLQLFLHFDQLPAYTATITGKKVEVVLTQTSSEENLKSPETDSKIIKMTSRQADADTVIAFYFRYPPQKVTPKASPETATLMLDIIVGNPMAYKYPDLTSKLQGVSVLSRTDSRGINPKNASRYANNWPLLFSEYETPVTITPTPSLHLPTFPLAAMLSPAITTTQWLPAEIQSLATENKWGQMLRPLREQIPNQPDEHLKERLLLTYAEALVRAGNYQEPYALLQEIGHNYADSLMADLARFLFIYLGAAKNDLFTAYFELESFIPRLSNTPCIAHLKLLLAELALLTGNTEAAEQLLKSNEVTAEPQLNDLRQLREADLLYLQNKKTEALAAYSALAKSADLVDRDAFALAHFSDCLYAGGRYEEAGKKYQILSALLTDDPQHGLALFRQAMCQLRLPSTASKARISLAQIHDAYPRSEGGFRAQMKETDLNYSSGRTKPGRAAALYGTLAVDSPTVALREEAGLKQAVVNSLAGEHRASVDQAMTLLREFQAGALRVEAQALLVDQLPAVINGLVKEKEYVKALVLAKQNKLVFARGWLDNRLLFDLAEAYNHLGLTDQTALTYQYLFEVTPESGREAVYLPYIRALFAAGRYVQVEEFSERYAVRNPNGKDWPSILQLKIQALFESGQIDQAQNLLHRKDTVLSPQLEILQARIDFQKKQWLKVIDILSRPELKEAADNDRCRFLLAESYFQSDKDDMAALLFIKPAEKGSYSEQAQFRLAQIESHRNNFAEALNLFNKLAEKGKDPMWTKLAREEAAILQLQHMK